MIDVDLQNIYLCAQKEFHTAEDIVNALAESTVIVPVLESMIDKGEANTSMPEDQKAEFIAAVDKLEDTEKAETLRKILGLN